MAVATLAFAGGCGSRNVTPTPTSSANHGSLNKDQVIRHMNGHRSKPLVRHAQLDAAAQSHADWMASRNNLSHTQGSSGSTPSMRITAAGYSWSAVAENIAAGQTTEQEVVAGWYQSPGHKANMLGNYRHTGVGIAKSQDGTVYWAAVYANPG